MKVVVSVMVMTAFFLGRPLWVDCSETETGAAGALQSVQADFVQEKHLKILARPLISKGRFIYQAPQSLRWEFLEPLHTVLVMHRGEVKKLVEKDGHLVEEPGVQIGFLQVILAEMSDWINGRFSDSGMFSAEVVDDQTIWFIPRNQGLSAVVSRIEIRTAGDDGLLDRVTIFEGADSYTEMIFSNRVLNEPVPDSLFTVK